MIILSSNGFIKVNYHIEVTLRGSRQRSVQNTFIFSRMSIEGYMVIIAESYVCFMFMFIMFIMN